MEFKTSKQWKHQIGLTDDGFYWDSNYYPYSDVYSSRGIPSRTNVNFAHYEHLDEFYFELLLKNGQLLVQEVKTTHRAKSVFLMGNTTDAARELSVLYKILLKKTSSYRSDKYIEYAESHSKWLLYINQKENIRLSGDDKYNFYLNEELMGNWKDETMEIWQLANKCTICFSRSNSGTMFSKGFEANVDIFQDHDIIPSMYELVGLNHIKNEWLIND